MVSIIGRTYYLLKVYVFSEFSLPLQKRKYQDTQVANKVLRLPCIYEQQTGSHAGLDQHWLKPSI